MQETYTPNKSDVIQQEERVVFREKNFRPSKTMKAYKRAKALGNFARFEGPMIRR